MLEEDVSVLGRAAKHRVLRSQRTGTELGHGVHIHHFLQILIVPDLDLLDLVRGPETVKKVDEGDSALDGGKMGHRSQIHHFLRVGLSKHGKTGLPAGVHIGMVAENVQRMRSDATGGHMKNAGEQFACNLVHIGNHQKKALRCRVGRSQSAGRQRAVHRTGRTCLRLHLHHLHGGAEDVLQSLRRPLIHIVRHGAGRSDGVNTGNLGKGVADMRRRIVAVHG